MDTTIEGYVRQAKNGDKSALETVVVRIQDRIYGLALRMLGDPADAEDQTQEILIKVITHLGGFREESAFSSWIYRIACNHLLTAQRRNRQHQALTFDGLEDLLAEDTGHPHPQLASGPERDFLLEEARLSCMQSVLACLDGKTRIAFILGEMFGITSQEGAYIFDISPAAFRKRLSRGRKKIQAFMSQHCGLVDEKNTCRCHKIAARNLPRGLGLERRPMINEMEAPAQRVEARRHLKELSEIDRATAIYRRYPEYRRPESFAYIVKDLIESGKYRVLIE